MARFNGGRAASALVREQAHAKAPMAGRNPAALAVAGAVRIANDERLTEQILCQLCINALRTRTTTDEMLRFVMRMLSLNQAWAAETKNMAYYRETCVAIESWAACAMRACQKDAPPEPTTTERKAVEAVLQRWMKILDCITVRLFATLLTRWEITRERFFAPPGPNPEGVDYVAPLGP